MTAATRAARLLRERARSYARDAEGMVRLADLDPGDAAAMWTMARELLAVSDEVEKEGSHCGCPWCSGETTATGLCGCAFCKHERENEEMGL